MSDLLVGEQLWELCLNVSRGFYFPKIDARTDICWIVLSYMYMLNFAYKNTLKHFELTLF